MIWVTLVIVFVAGIWRFIYDKGRIDKLEYKLGRRDVDIQTIKRDMNFRITKLEVRK